MVNFFKMNEVQILLSGNNKYVIKNYSEPNFLFRTVSLLKSLNHDNVIKVTNVNYIDYNFTSKFYGNTLNYILFSLNLERRKKIFFHIFDAINYCHKNKIIHCDIKPNNIAISENDEPTIIDFDNCILYPSTVELKDRCTVQWESPELLSEDGFYTYSSDIWSIGQILFESVTGEYMLYRRNDNSIFKINEYRSYFFDKILESESIYSKIENLDEREVIKKSLTFIENRAKDIDEILSLKYFKEFRKTEKEDDNELIVGVNKEHRYILYEWLIQLIIDIKLPPVIWFLTVDISDRYARRINYSKYKLQIVLCASLVHAVFILYEKTIEWKDMIDYADYSFSEKEIIEVHKDIIIFLDGKLGISTFNYVNDDKLYELYLLLLSEDTYKRQEIAGKANDINDLSSHEINTCELNDTFKDFLKH